MFDQRMDINKIVKEAFVRNNMKNVNISLLLCLEWATTYLCSQHWRKRISDHFMSGLS